MLEAELDKAGQGKVSKEERRAKAARDRIFDRVFDDLPKSKKGTGFADPALMFG